MMPPSQSRKGQSAVEAMVTVGIAIAFILPMALLFFSSAGIRTQTLAQVQANGLAQQIADTAGEVWYAGNGSRKIVLLHYPDRLLSIQLGGDLLKDDAGNPAPCPPFVKPGAQPPTISPALYDEQLHRAGREVTLTMDNSLSGRTSITALSPALLCGTGLYAAQSLNYAPGRQPGSALTPGLVLVLFKNEGDYVNITRYSVQYTKGFD